MCHSSRGLDIAFFSILCVLNVLLFLFIAYLGGSFGWNLYSIIEKPATKCKKEKLSEYPFENGDLLLFSGNNLHNIMSYCNIIQMLMTNTPITHVAMVVRDPRNQSLLCWELAMGEKIPNLLRLTNLHSRISSYKGHVYVRKLTDRNNPRNILSAQSTYNFVISFLKENRKEIVSYRKFFYFNSYDRFCTFLHPPLPYLGNPSPMEKKEYICTDVISLTYHALKVFDKLNFDFWPRDFYSLTECLPLSRGESNWFFETEIRLKKDLK